MNTLFSPQVSKNSHNERESLNDRLMQLAKHCQKYKGAHTGHSIFQLVSTLVLYIASVVLMIMAYENHYWLTLLLTLPTGGFVVRLFIFQHDCGHQSFFNSRKWNNRVGRLLSLITVTPYNYWRQTHNIHHASSGNLSKRGIGDLDTLTVQEYLARPLLGRLAYRLYRNPVVILFIGGPLQTLILQRFPLGQPLSFKKIWKSIMGLNLALLVVYATALYFIGAERFLLTYLPIICVSTWVGGWLFFVQHQFEDTDWDYKEDWDFNKAAILGSTYYDLPKILHWFSGNIGFHHLHHLCGVIPNYRLKECHDAAPEMPEIRKLRLWESLKCIHLTLWDEDLRKLVGFSHLKSQRARVCGQ